MRATFAHHRGVIARGASGAALTGPAGVNTGIAFWYKADAISGLSNADPVVSWTDSSGNGRTAVTDASGNRPTYRTGVLNSLPVVRFDGTDDYMGIPYVLGNSGGAMSALVVAKQSGTSGDLLSTRRSTNQGWIIRLGTTTWLFGHIGGSNLTRTFTTTSGFALYEVVRSTSSSADVGQNGTLTNGNPGTFGASPNTVTHMGAEGQISGSASQQFLNGDIAEVIGYDTALSSTDRDAIESYIATKYALTIA